MTSTTNDFSDARIDKLERHIDVIYEKQNIHSASLARVEASSESMSADIKFLVEQINAPAPPEKTTQWVVIAIMMASIVGTLSYAFVSPIDQMVNSNRQNLSHFIERHNSQEIESSYASGVTAGKAESQRAYMESLAVLAQDNQNRLRKAERIMSVLSVPE